MTARIGMTQLPRRVASYLNTTSVPGYRTFFNAAVDGRFPAEFAGNRWTVAESDIPVIAQAMGLTPKTGAPPAKKIRKVSAAVSAAA